MSVPAKKPSAFLIRKRRIGHLMRHLLQIAPWLTSKDFATARNWCEFEVVGAELFAKIVERGVETKKGELSALVDAHGRLRARQLTYATRLGLHPAAREELRQRGRDIEDIELSPERTAEAIKARAQTGHHLPDEKT